MYELQINSIWNYMVSHLPITNPVLKFLLILIIILFAPIVLNKFRIPPLLGMIIAGTIIGTNGLNLMERDSSIILSGTAGLLYIMFLAGLEIDLIEFKKNRSKSIVFGLYTFIVPMLFGIVAGYFILQFSMASSILLASMFASHTLIAYPLVSKIGVAKNKAVNITIGGTMITDTLALLVLAVIVGSTKGELNQEFWLSLSASITLFALIVMIGFPILSRWFFKNYQDHVSQYIFVLVMLFLGSFLAELAGIEAIIGAFLSGLALNRLIPHTSALMNRIEFVGNAIFIPFFLIGVGMLVDFRMFFQSWETIKVAFIMIFVATFAKFLAAWLTQKTFKLSIDERRLIFGLSNAQAAATLAAVLVGYNIIVGKTSEGEDIRLLSESVLNGTILMILVTCTIASFVAQKGATNIALQDANNSDNEKSDDSANILISLNNLEQTEELVNLGINLKSKSKNNNLFVLNIVGNQSDDENADRLGKMILEKATKNASATDNQVISLLRYDVNITNGIISVVKENKINDLILGLHWQNDISMSFLGEIIDGILAKANLTTFIYEPKQPFATFKRIIIVVPANAEKEIGFPFWLIKIWNLAKNTGIKLVFYCTADTMSIIQEIQKSHPIDTDFVSFENWEDLLFLSRDFQIDDNLIFILSRKDKVSYHYSMSKLPQFINKYFHQHSCMLVYPMQSGVNDSQQLDLTNPTALDSLEKLDEIGKTIGRIFKKR